MVTRELLRNNISRSNRIESNIRKVPVYRPQNDTISIPPDALNLARNVIFARANCLSRTFVIFSFWSVNWRTRKPEGRVPSPGGAIFANAPEASQEHQAVPTGTLVGQRDCFV